MTRGGEPPGGHAVTDPTLTTAQKAALRGADEKAGAPPAADYGPGLPVCVPEG